MCFRHRGFTFSVVIVAAPVKIVSSRKVAQVVEKKMAHTNIKFRTTFKKFPVLLHTWMLQKRRHRRRRRIYIFGNGQQRGCTHLLL